MQSCLWEWTIDEWCGVQVRATFQFFTGTGKKKPRIEEEVSDDEGHEEDDVSRCDWIWIWICDVAGLVL